jgi:hypothetical protein
MSLQLRVWNLRQPVQRCLPVRIFEQLLDLLADFSAVGSGHIIIFLCLVQFVFSKEINSTNHATTAEKVTAFLALP